MKKFHLTAQVTAVLVIFIHFACQQDTPSNDSIVEQRVKKYAQYDLNAFLLNKINKNRIVMLGDHEHGQGLYYRVVINFLNYCLDQIKQNANQEIPFKLTLFLEHDSLSNQRLYRFFYSNNLMDFVEPEDFVVSFTADKVEFIYDLRDFHFKIKEINNTISSDHKIHFQIIGPEKIIDSNNEFSDTFSIGERDRYSADQICRYLETHPDHKALIFYGAAHLFREGMPTSHPGRSSYRLAHLLTKEYKNRGGCYTIFQYALKGTSWYPKIFVKPKKSCAIENLHFKGLKFDRHRSPYDSDASFLLNNYYEKAVHVSQVPTNNFINLFLDCLPIYLKAPEREGNKWVIKAAVHYLQMVSGFPTSPIDFNDIDTLQKYLTEWKLWYLQNGFDPVTWTIGYQFLLRPFQVYHQTPNAQKRMEVELALRNILGGIAPDTLITNPDEQIRVWLIHLEQNKIPILAPRLIQIMWVGTEDEQQQACKALQNLNKEDFMTPKEWTKWWRKKRRVVEQLSGVN